MIKYLYFLVSLCVADTVLQKNENCDWAAFKRIPVLGVNVTTQESMVLSPLTSVKQDHARKHKYAKADDDQPDACLDKQIIVHTAYLGSRVVLPNRSDGNRHSCQRDCDDTNTCVGQKSVSHDAP